MLNIFPDLIPSCFDKYVCLYKDNGTFMYIQEGEPILSIVYSVGASTKSYCVGEGINDNIGLLRTNKYSFEDVRWALDQIIGKKTPLSEAIQSTNCGIRINLSSFSDIDQLHLLLFKEYFKNIKKIYLNFLFVPNLHMWNLVNLDSEYEEVLIYGFNVNLNEKPYEDTDYVHPSLCSHWFSNNIFDEHKFILEYIANFKHWPKWFNQHSCLHKSFHADSDKCVLTYVENKIQNEKNVITHELKHSLPPYTLNIPRFSWHTVDCKQVESISILNGSDLTNARKKISKWLKVSAKSIYLDFFIIQVCINLVHTLKNNMWLKTNVLQLLRLFLLKENGGVSLFDHISKSKNGFTEEMTFLKLKQFSTGTKFPWPNELTHALKLEMFGIYNETLDTPKYYSPMVLYDISDEVEFDLNEKYGHTADFQHIIPLNDGGSLDCKSLISNYYAYPCSFGDRYKSIVDDIAKIFPSVKNFTDFPKFTIIGDTIFQLLGQLNIETVCVSVDYCPQETILDDLKNLCDVDKITCFTDAKGFLNRFKFFYNFSKIGKKLVDVRMEYLTLLKRTGMSKNKIDIYLKDDCKNLVVSTAAYHVLFDGVFNIENFDMDTILLAKTFSAMDILPIVNKKKEVNNKLVSKLKEFEHIDKKCYILNFNKSGHVYYTNTPIKKAKIG